MYCLKVSDIVKKYMEKSKRDFKVLYRMGTCIERCKTNLIN